MVQDRYRSTTTGSEPDRTRPRLGTPQRARVARAGAAMHGQSPVPSARSYRAHERVRVVVDRTSSCQDCPHFDGEAERTGRVLGRHPSPYAPSHPYNVLFDTPCIVMTCRRRPTRLYGRYYAADELEPIA